MIKDFKITILRLISNNSLKDPSLLYKFLIYQIMNLKKYQEILKFKNLVSNSIINLRKIKNNFS